MLIRLPSIIYANVKRLTPQNVKGISPKLADYHAKSPPTPLKAEALAAGATLQRLGGGGGGEKSKRLSYLRFKALFCAK